MNQPGTDMERVRLVLARELETINEYERLAREADSPEVKAFFAHLAAEEKEHVAEATLVLRQLDAKQDAYFVQGIAPGHFEGAPSAAPAGPVAPAAPAPQPASPAANLGPRPPSGFTVGTALEDGRLPPLDPQQVVHALPAAPAPSAAPFTVGSLKRRTP